MKKYIPIIIILYSILSLSIYCQECESSSAYNEITNDINIALANAKNFKVLYLSDWTNDIPDSLFKFSKLNELTLYLMKSNYLPITLGKINNICYLDVLGNSKLKLDDFFILIKDYKRIVRLSLSFWANNFWAPDIDSSLTTDIVQKIPQEIRNLKSIYDLSIIKCNINYIPPELAELPNLSYLDLSENIIDTIPEYISKIISLQILKLSANKFRYLPIQLFYMKNLKRLTFDGNPQLDLKDLFDKSKILENPIALSLQNCSITSIPKDPMHYNKIDELDLSNNNLDEIPEEIFMIESIKELILSYNNISVIPENISEAKNLETLFISNNKIKKFPINLSKCLKLKYIFIYDNPIPEEEVERMQKLMPNTKFEYKFIKDKIK